MRNHPPTKPLVYALVMLTLLVGRIATAADINREFEDIANRLVNKIAATNKTKVAVADLTDLQGIVHQLGRFASEEISINLVLAAPKFTVIDRNHLRTILKEQKLSMSGLMDPANQKKLGKILGVDALILGSITSFGESYRITFKVVATDTAQVVAADRGSIPKTPATNELWDTIIEDDLVIGGGTSSVQGVPRVVRMPKKGVFRNQYVELAIESVAVQKGRKTLALVARLTNLTKGEIYVVASKQSTVVDDAGTSWMGSVISGLDTYPRDTRSFHMKAGKSSSGAPDHYMSLMPAGHTQPLNYVFGAQGDSTDAKRLSFSTTIYLKVPAQAKGAGNSKEWRYFPVGVGISGIQLR